MPAEVATFTGNYTFTMPPEVDFALQPRSHKGVLLAVTCLTTSLERRYLPQCRQLVLDTGGLHGHESGSQQELRRSLDVTLLLCRGAGRHHCHP